MKLTATQTKALAKLNELAAKSADGTVDVSYPIKGVNTNSKWALNHMGVITIAITIDKVTGVTTMIATIN